MFDGAAHISRSLSPWDGASAGCRWRNDLQYGR